MHDTIQPARAALAQAIACVKEEEDELAKRRQGAERCRDQLAELDAKLIEANTAHAMAMKEAPRLRALAYIDGGGVEERDIPADATAAVLESLNRLHAQHREIAATLDAEMVACQRRLEIAQRRVTAQVAAVLEASPEFAAFQAQFQSAWERLRTMRVTLDAVIKLTSGNLPQSAYQLLNRSEPLDRRVGYEVDDAFIHAWEQAVERLSTDANAKLPT